MKHTKWMIVSLFLSFTLQGFTQNNGKIQFPADKTALLIIDVQQFYFPGGQVPLVHPEKTSLKIKEVLEAFRKSNMEVIHIRHQISKNAEIHPNVAPLENEKVFVKKEANSFNGTDLSKYLKNNQITHLVITGMQTHMCVEATTRAAYDMGYQCIVPEETSTTRNLKYKDHTIPAMDVHYSTLSTLKGGYAKIVELQTLLNSLK